MAGNGIAPIQLKMGGGTDSSSRAITKIAGMTRHISKDFTAAERYGAGWRCRKRSL